MNSYDVTIQMKPLQHDFYTVLFIIQHLTNRILNFVYFCCPLRKRVNNNNNNNNNNANY